MENHDILNKSSSFFKKALAFGLFLIAGVLHSQTSIKTDQQAAVLMATIKRSKPDTAKVSVMVNLSEWYRIGETPEAKANRIKAIVFANRAQNLSKTLDYPKGIAQSNLQFAKIEENAHNYAKAKAFIALAIHQAAAINEYNLLGESHVIKWSIAVDANDPIPDRIAALEKAVTAFDLGKNVLRKGDCQKELGDLYQINGQYARALTVLKEALANFNAAKYKKLFGLYDLLGNVYTLLGDYKEGINYGLLAIRNAEELGTGGLSVCTIYNRMGVSYSRVSDLKRALGCFEKSLDIAKKYNDPQSILILTVNTAETLQQLKRNEEARVLMLAMMKKYSWFSSETDPVINVTMLSIYTHLKQFSAAAVYCKKLESMIKGLGPGRFGRMEIYQILIAYFIKINRFDKAAYYNKLYHEERYKNDFFDDGSADYWQFKIDSIDGHFISAIKSYQSYKAKQDKTFNTNKSRQISQLGILYETEKKNKDIQTLKRKSEVQQANLKQAQTSRNITFGGAALLIVILILLFIGYRQNIRSNKLLQVKQDEINLKNNSLQGLLTEKEWLLREIHHRVKNNLHMVVGLLASQTEFIKGKEALDAISESQHRVQAMSLIHQKLYQTDNLSLIVMSDYVFELTQYLKMSFDSKSQIRFSLDVEKAEFPLSHSIPIGIMITEAVTNSIKYAFPNTKEGTIGIALHAVKDDTYTLRMWDDGIGIRENFNPEDSDSLGMRLIEGLANEIHSELKIYNDGGTVIELTFTLPDNLNVIKAS